MNRCRLSPPRQPISTGIIIHNDAQHFSAGVDLNAFRAYIEAEDWAGIDGFLDRFQKAVCALKYTPVPVVGAPSGLAAGGGYEVLAHCDRLVVHTNSVMGLVEAGVGVVPGGGGIKDTFFRWHEAKGNWDDAAWQTWMNIGYAIVGHRHNPDGEDDVYFRDGHEETGMNRTGHAARHRKDRRSAINMAPIPPVARLPTGTCEDGRVHAAGDRPRRFLPT